MLADKVLTLGILAIVSLIFGQLISKEKALDWSLLLIAFAIFIICTILSYFLMKGISNDTR